MIRAATIRDFARVKELIHEMHARSPKYWGQVGISEKALQQLLCTALAGQRSPKEMGSFFHVVDCGGRVQGFMIGILNRVYQIGNLLEAQDVFLYVTKDGPATAAARLAAAYIKWADDNDRVLDIKLSWNDTLPGAGRVAKLYQKLGFRRCGEIWERRTFPQQMEAAA